MRGDLAYRHVLAGCLAGLDEVEVILQEARVEDGHNAVLAAYLADVVHILQGERLAADEVRAGLYAQEGDVLRARLGDEAAQLVEVDVALEGVVARGLYALVAEQLGHGAAEAGDVRLGRGEVEVHRHHVAGLHEGDGEDVLAGAALVGGEEEVRAEELVHLGLQPVEGRAAGVAVVADEHRGGLAVAHAVDAGVGQHVEEDVLVLEQEGVVARLGDGLGAALHGLEVQLLHHAHLVQLEGDVHTGEEFDVRHCFRLLSDIDGAVWRRLHRVLRKKKTPFLPNRGRAPNPVLPPQFTATSR